MHVYMMMMTLMLVDDSSSIRGIHLSDLAILKEKLEQEVQSLLQLY